jgi:uncharacterized protein (DUF4415 family)
MMTGLKTELKTTETMTRNEVLAAVRNIKPEAFYVWDGVDEDDRPLSKEEAQVIIANIRKQRGRPAGSGNKEQVAIRFDNEVLNAFRSAGPGWQTRMNDALKDWLRTHSAA